MDSAEDTLSTASTLGTEYRYICQIANPPRCKCERRAQVELCDPRLVSDLLLKTSALGVPRLFKIVGNADSIEGSLWRSYS